MWVVIPPTSSKTWPTPRAGEVAGDVVGDFHAASPDLGTVSAPRTVRRAEDRPLRGEGRMADSHGRLTPQHLADASAHVRHLLALQADAARQVHPAVADPHGVRARRLRALPDRVLADRREDGPRVDVPRLQGRAELLARERRRFLEDEAASSRRSRGPTRPLRTGGRAARPSRSSAYHEAISRLASISSSTALHLPEADRGLDVRHLVFQARLVDPERPVRVAALVPERAGPARTGRRRS